MTHPPIRFRGLPTDAVRALQAGGPNAYGMGPERAVSDGAGTPCRHCLRHTPAGAAHLVLAWRPFPAAQPYAETGPIFLCAEPCAAWSGAGPPPILDSPSYLLRAYDARDRIVYGTGAVTPTDAVEARAAMLLARPRVAYVHLRSAANNCFQARLELA